MKNTVFRKINCWYRQKENLKMNEQTDQLGVPRHESLHGAIKYYVRDKNYGSILGDDQLEYYLSEQDLNGIWFPSKGDRVSFGVSKTQKGKLKAINVVFIERMPEVGKSGYVDYKVTCLSCNRKMTPRSESHYGTLQRTYCPYCTATYVDKRLGSCFIATAAYSSECCH